MLVIVLPISNCLFQVFKETIQQFHFQKSQPEAAVNATIEKMETQVLCYL